MESSDVPRLDFEVQPGMVDLPARKSILAIGANRTITFVSGAPRFFTLRWPDEGGEPVARVALQLPDDSEPEDQRAGSWALFRLLDDATIRPRDDGVSYDVAWTLQGPGGRSHKAAYVFKARTLVNPFAPRFLDFVLPGSLVP